MHVLSYFLNESVLENYLALVVFNLFCLGYGVSGVAILFVEIYVFYIEIFMVYLYIEIFTD